MGEMGSEELLQGQLELWHHAFGYIKSMALKCAIDLRIPDAILRCGGTATLPDIAAATDLPACNLPYLRRIMRVLTLSRIFDQRHAGEEEEQKEAVYTLTAASRLLVEAAPLSQLHYIILAVDQLSVSPFLDTRGWIAHEGASTTTLFERAHGMVGWELTKVDARVASLLNSAMSADSTLTMHAVLAESPHVFQGATWLLDVGGNQGVATAAIAKEFPHLKCTVLDLPHVVAQAAPAATEGSNPVRFVGGDMFEHIPPADIVLLKWILHDWNDEDCVKILRECRKAIPPSGKVVIIDMVVGSTPGNPMSEETQAIFNLYMMIVNGIEREEKEWKKIFLEAGFVDYKISPVLGVRSIIEVYP